MNSHTRRASKVRTMGVILQAESETYAVQCDKSRAQFFHRARFSVRNCTSIVIEIQYTIRVMKKRSLQFFVLLTDFACAWASTSALTKANTSCQKTSRKFASYGIKFVIM